MTTPSRTKAKDNSFSSFAVGVSVGVAASLLFGTEEGRSLVKRIVDAIPDKYKNVPEPLERVVSEMTPHSTPTIIPVIPVQETPHHFTIRSEAPPPPAPLIRPSRPEPFHPH